MGSALPSAADAISTPTTPLPRASRSAPHCLLTVYQCSVRGCRVRHCRCVQVHHELTVRERVARPRRECGMCVGVHRCAMSNSEGTRRQAAAVPLATSAAHDVKSAAVAARCSPVLTNAAGSFTGAPPIACGRERSDGCQTGPIHAGSSGRSGCFTHYLINSSVFEVPAQTRRVPLPGLPSRYPVSSTATTFEVPGGESLRGSPQQGQNRKPQLRTTAIAATTGATTATAVSATADATAATAGSWRPPW